ncbi:MAG: hypothetical protein R3C99_13105 [Pirellulaceae bacterium]
MTLEAIEQAVAALSRQEQLQLLERLAHSLHQSDTASENSPPSEHDASKRKKALDDLRQELAQLPVMNPDDGLSNRDHDRVLYGEEQQ